MSRWRPLGATLVVLGLATGAAAFEPRPTGGAGDGLPTTAATRALQVAPPLAMIPGYVPVPPAYPRPPRGFRPLPSARPPALATSLDPRGARVWVPGRTEVVVGLDDAGRVVHVLEHVPGHVREVPPRPLSPVVAR